MTKSELYSNAFKEVNDILINTDENLVSKIPESFKDFLRANMNLNYKTAIDYTLPIDKQKLLPETEAILTLIYKSYWKEENKPIIKDYFAEAGFGSNDVEKIKETKSVLESDMFPVIVKKESFWDKVLKFLKLKKP